MFPPPQTVATDLLQLPDAAARQTYLQDRLTWPADAAWTDALAQALKQRADHLLRANVARAREAAQTLSLLAQWYDNPAYEALSLRVRGNILGVGMGQWATSLACYDEAAAIYRTLNQPAAAAGSLVGKIGSLANLSRYDEAVALGREIQPVLAAHEEWALLSGVVLNLVLIHKRLGQARQALTLLEEAEAICHQAGVDQHLAGILHNRALVLLALGNLPAAITASQQAHDLFLARGHHVEAARAQQCQAIILLTLGRFNEALTRLDQAQRTFIADGRHNDAQLVDLFAGDCLLQLGRYQEVLQKAGQIRALFAEQGAPYKMTQAMLSEAVAYAGINQFPRALATLDDAAARFAAEGNTLWAAISHLEKAALLARQGEWTACAQTAAACQATFHEHHAPLEAAKASLLLGQAALAQENGAEAKTHLQIALDAGRTANLPWLQHRAHHVLGALAHASGSTHAARTHFHEAITQLERLSGRLMLEFRADFLADKQQVYADAITLALAENDVEAAFHYAERARSRALLELLAYQLEVRVEARAAADEPLVAELTHLRDRRNQLYRRWRTNQERRSLTEMQQEMLTLEEAITARWRQLLVRNADYAQDAAQSAAGEAVAPPAGIAALQPHLPADTAVLEYHILHDEGQRGKTIIAFLLTRHGVTARRLAATPAQLAAPARLLHLNLQAAALTPLRQHPALIANAQARLRQLHRLLLAPLVADLAPYRRLIIVPHGPLLHYLPFAALHDGAGYLVEQMDLSILPSASLLPHLPAPPPPLSGHAAAFGHSHGGELPHAPAEAAAVANLLRGRAYLEAEATRTAVAQAAARASVLHLATHGDFRPENPLFSGLALADGQIATLDVFHWRMPASLVVLSACQTGRSVVSGGDELLGLMRAFLSAGASALVLSLWQVADAATRELMTHFYRRLIAGEAAATALRQAQCHLLQNSHAHPYFWASFFVVGQTWQD